MKTFSVINAFSNVSLNIRRSITTQLTHWGRVTHICISKFTIIASDNGLSPGRRLVIIWTSAGILLIGPLGTNFSEISIEIITFSFIKMRLKVSSAKWRPCCFGLNVLNAYLITISTEQAQGNIQSILYTIAWVDKKIALLNISCLWSFMFGCFSITRSLDISLAEQKLNHK